MTQTDRIEALEAQVALLTAAIAKGDPTVAALMVAPAEEPAEEGAAE